jgi:hypothetical protein
MKELYVIRRVSVEVIQSFFVARSNHKIEILSVVVGGGFKKCTFGEVVVFGVRFPVMLQV